LTGAAYLSSFNELGPYYQKPLEQQWKLMHRFIHQTVRERTSPASLTSSEKRGIPAGRLNIIHNERFHLKRVGEQVANLKKGSVATHTLSLSPEELEMS
jgi:hypothetical protein